MELTHLDDKGRAKMVDVSQKSITLRRAVASGVIQCNEKTIELITTGKIEKGDVFACARIAGIMAAKRTPELIPLCHGIGVQSVELDIYTDLVNSRIIINATAITEAKTGLEMEALTAVSIACLCIYDMCKAVDKGMVIGDIKLMSKSGGKSGDYVRR